MTHRTKLVTVNPLYNGTICPRMCWAVSTIAEITVNVKIVKQTDKQTKAKRNGVYLNLKTGLNHLLEPDSAGSFSRDLAICLSPAVRGF